MPYKDKETQLAYFRKKNREPARWADMKLRTSKAAQFKKDLLSQFPCVCCGETDPDLIDWHHVIPKDKLHNITRFNLNHEDFKIEIENNQKKYEQLIDEAADQISNFVKKAKIDNLSQ